MPGDAGILSTMPASGEFEDGFDPMLLKLYYGKLFPSHLLIKWLSYGNSEHAMGDASFMPRREFSMTLENDIYCRYLSFKDAAEFEEELARKVPHKIDVGAVFNVNPAKRNTLSNRTDRLFVPVEKELVFDVDLTDYDDVRSCCTGATICRKCWSFITVAIRVVDDILRNDFGFRHILWVYSGRRGIHAWVCDAKARRLTNEQRTAVIEYISVQRGKADKVVQLSYPLHPTLERVYHAVLLPAFDRVLEEQGLLDTEEACEKILAFLPGDKIREGLRIVWKRSMGGASTSAERWADVLVAVKRALDQTESHKNLKYQLLTCVQEIVFAHTFPRLDVEVSKHLNHLLKCPFCVHPKTGRICVPVDPAQLESFDPLAVPSLGQVLNELNRSVEAAGTAGTVSTGAPDAEGMDDTKALQAVATRAKNIEMTSLGEWVAVFNRTFLQGIKQENLSNFRRAAEERGGKTVDW